ncbi:MAG: thioredoxin domain-containing protein [Mariprofundaceae bacterium]|nr:thioredoxin domain-containing protein [Mariprofundaceae bacterium]
MVLTGLIADATEDKMKHNNALLGESSPYLQQHAHNPVNWQPWGENAFAMARLADKPIFLSIGYSTCHWCHVMERESFEDEDVAAAMNATFVSIKVDREERPDIDQVYMQVAQMMTGGGGWPLNVILTPEGKPFYAATYLPKHSGHGRMGIIELSNRIHSLWQEDRQRLLASADSISQSLQDKQSKNDDHNNPVLTSDWVTQAYQQFNNTFDHEHGGFGAAPKFPAPHKLMLLMRYADSHEDSTAMNMVETTLDRMRAGGIFDQLGYGFHRYATDSEWLLPHFEKMLYDQALLMMAYTEAFQATGHERHALVVDEIAQYVLRDMRAPDGAFYTAEDADSEGEEGRFYLWRETELQQYLSKEDAALAVRYWGIRRVGNFLDEARRKRTGHNILHIAEALTNADDKKSIKRIQKILLKERSKRIRPFRDEKIMADWNGLMIAALAKAGTALNRPDLYQAAAKAATAVLARLHTEDGVLWHSRASLKQQGTMGHLDDYAFLTWGLLELYESGFEGHYLSDAIALNKQMIAQFSDSKGGFYLTAKNAELLLVRPKDAWDGAIPSGNAVAMANLVRLARMTGDFTLENMAEKGLKSFAPLMQQAPTGQAFMLGALWQYLTPSYELVIAGDSSKESIQALLPLRQGFFPTLAMLFRDKTTIKLVPFIAMQKPVKNRLTFYLCHGKECRPPVHDVQHLLKLTHR